MLIYEKTSADKCISIQNLYALSLTTLSIKLKNFVTLNFQHNYQFYSKPITPSFLYI